jgi:hypothetical protein
MTSRVLGAVIHPGLKCASMPPRASVDGAFQPRAAVAHTGPTPAFGLR